MRICITRSERHSYSETFIRDQITGLSKLAEVYTIHSGRLPERSEDGGYLSSLPFWVLHKIVKSITGQRNNFFGNFGIKKFLVENKIDVVLANYGLTAAHMAPICEALQIPLIVIFHGHDATDKKLLRQYVSQYKSLFRIASSIVVVSNDMQKRIVQMGAPQEKMSVVPCGVDLEKFKPLSVQRSRMFLAVGRFVPKKGPMNTIKAFYEVWKRNPDAVLIMVGAHKGLHEKCLKLVASLRMETAVIFPGILKQEDIRVFMSNALAFVQHSMTAANGDMEGTPVSILEASASGLPVISTFHGGISDAVIHEKTGFLVEEGDVEGMARYLAKILDDPALGASMGAAGRLHIETNYDQVKQIGKLHALATKAIQK